MPNSISDFLSHIAATAKSTIKIALSGRPSAIPCGKHDTPLLILGNGPSLRGNIDHDLPLLQANDTLAVNFAANSPEFPVIRPDYYVLADPHFFSNPDDPNVSRLIQSLLHTDWTMTLFVPRKAKIPKALESNQNLTVKRFNFVAAEGFGAFENFAYRHRLGMPRPRNVLIPSIMLGIWLGYREIYLLGADHTWTKTLSVDNDNRVLSIQPHFYKEDAHEECRIRKAYMNLPLHSILESFHIAFKSYHRIQAYAEKAGVNIFNATPGSFIDAFPRKALPSDATTYKN